MEKKLTYHSSGYVWGNCWGGGQCGYAARKHSASSWRGLMKINNDALKTGSLDSGMGYESLTGALLTFVTKTEIQVDGKTFVNTEEEQVVIGKLSQQAYDILLQQG